MTYEIVKS